ncbi:MAG TPA: carboxylesterase/lipase family protein [Kofleriaceae bacterium]
MANLVVETTHGKVRGELHSDVAMWKGIPYAAPPVGALRFRPPRPPTPWPGERDATQFGSVAAQSRDPRIAIMSGIAEKVVSGEDCLVLNVFAPAGAAGSGQRLPVMVWIHGGAFVMGSGSTPLYHGHTFAEQGIVAVTLNYRLGLPGFLYLGDLAPGREEGNYALLDQIAALRWVQDNIAAFGGDPDMVTVMGESAGAISIGTLMGMPAARGLFHRAILDSGAPSLGPPTRADATRVARGVLAELGVGVDELAGIAIDRLIEVQVKMAQTSGLAAFAPYVDGAAVPRLPIDAIRDGSAAGIPILLGSNRDEWTLFEVFLGEVSVEAFQAPLRLRLGALVDPLLEVYRDAHPDRSVKRAWVDLIGELVFRIPAIRLAETQSSRGEAVYMYRFDWKSPAFGGRLGAAHALELPFVWNRLDLPMAPVLLGDRLSQLQPLANAIHGSWVQFIRSGDPNGGGLPPWPRYDAERRSTLIIDRDSRVEDDPAGTARAMWPEVWPD